MNEKPKIRFPIIVEGRYDKAVLSSLVSALIISLDGFSVFNSKEKQALVRRVSRDGVILLTDSDGGGRQLRSFISSIVPSDKLYHLYIPKIKGKEKRKTKRSKEGLLGVEGMAPELLLNILSPFCDDNGARVPTEKLTAADFYLDGYTGKADSSLRRAQLAAALGLPQDMSAKALIAAINMLGLYEDYKAYTKNKQN